MTWCLAEMFLAAQMKGGGEQKVCDVFDDLRLQQKIYYLPQALMPAAQCHDLLQEMGEFDMVVVSLWKCLWQ